MRQPQRSAPTLQVENICKDFFYKYFFAFQLVENYETVVENYIHNLFFLLCVNIHEILLNLNAVFYMWIITLPTKIIPFSVSITLPNQQKQSNGTVFEHKELEQKVSETWKKKKKLKKRLKYSLIFHLLL